jgi:hypothetical protein
MHPGIFNASVHQKRFRPHGVAPCIPPVLSDFKGRQAVNEKKQQQGTQLAGDEQLRIQHPGMSKPTKPHFIIDGDKDHD